MGGCVCVFDVCSLHACKLMSYSMYTMYSMHTVCSVHVLHMVQTVCAIFNYITGNLRWLPFL